MRSFVTILSLEECVLSWRSRYPRPEYAATRYGCKIQGATEVALGLLDVLGYLDEIPICTAYDVLGERTDAFPTPAKLDDATPVYETARGWKTDISAIRRYGALPDKARRYVERIEELIGTPIRWISVGPQRDAVLRCE